MNGCFKLALVLLLTARAQSEDKCSYGPNDKKCTYVVNHSFCEANLPPEDIEPKKTLGEVYSYYILYNKLSQERIAFQSSCLETG